MKQNNIGEFGEQFTQFFHQPKEAIKYLKRVKRGECIAAMYRSDIGNIDIPWGEVTSQEKHTGFGLAHIIDKHGADIKALGFEVEDFIPIIIQFGDLVLSKNSNRYVLESKQFRIVIARDCKGVSKNWLLTTFNLKKKPKARKPSA